MSDDIEIKVTTLKPSGKKLSFGGWDPSKPPPEAPAPTKPHPREGYVVEVWLGKTVKINEETNAMVLGLVLVEIHECYRQDGSGPSYHYHPHDLLGGKSMGIKTIGALGLDEMRDFAKRYSGPSDAEWSQVR